DRVAWLRLKEAGYQNVSVLKGGLDAYRDAGWQVEGQPIPPSSPEGIYHLDPEASRVHWTGRNLLNQHTGTIDASAGEVEVNAAGIPLRGTIEVDMTRIHCEDLTDPGLANMLVDHLVSRDF